jgi:hypothetical protein
MRRFPDTFANWHVSLTAVAGFICTHAQKAQAGVLIPESLALFQEDLLIYPRELFGMDAEYPSDLLTYAIPTHWECRYASEPGSLQVSAWSLSTFHLATFMRAKFKTQQATAERPISFYAAGEAEQFETFSTKTSSLSPELGLTLQTDGVPIQTRGFLFGQLSLPKQRADAGLGAGAQIFRPGTREGIDLEARVLFEDTPRNENGAFDDSFAPNRSPVTIGTRLLWVFENKPDKKAPSPPACLLVRARRLYPYQWNVPLSDESLTGYADEIALAASLPVLSGFSHGPEGSPEPIEIWLLVRSEHRLQQRRWRTIDGDKRAAAQSERIGAREYAPAGSGISTAEHFAQIQMNVWKGIRPSGFGADAGLAWHAVIMKREHAETSAHGPSSTSAQFTWLPNIWLRTSVFTASEAALGVEWSFAHTEREEFPQLSTASEPGANASRSDQNNGRINLQWSSALNEALEISLLGSWDLDEQGLRRRFEGGMGQIQARF